jgi:signal transduction histidine kinase
MVLVAAGVVALLVGEVGWSQGLRAVAVLLLFAGGAALVAALWLVRGYTDLMAERRLRIREQERTEIAAQVHDSVLQTLTLIQNHAEEPQRVMQLARSEERRLRSWLYRPLGDQRDSLAAGLQHAAAGVEDQQGATVEVVNVGDAAWSDGVEAIVAAAGEAMVNAAKHAGPGAVVSVYSECGDGWARVFVKDRGSGFCLGAVPADRRGIRDSIMARMRRVGGTAEVITGDGGTEVRLGVQVGQR